MLCEKIIGRMEDWDLNGKVLDYVDIEWYEAFKKIHRKISRQGREVGIRLNDQVLSRGLYEGDILYADEQLILAVCTPACEVLKFSAPPDHNYMTVKACYEIGNRHAPLFQGEKEGEYVTPYDEPMHQMLQKIHRITVSKTVQKLDFRHRISAAVHNHHH